MGKKLDDNSRDTLNYRPNIDYEEPDALEGEINPIEIDEADVQEARELRNKARTLAEAVNLLAVATQGKIDDYSKNVLIKLDPIVDGAVVQSVKRLFGDGKINPYEITYQQYRECKDRLLQKGVDLGKKNLVTPESLIAAKESLGDTGSIFVDGAGDPNKINVAPLANLGKPNADDGSLRPELQEEVKVLEPLDLEQFQAYIVRSFMNAVWKKFIKPAMPDAIAKALPDEIAEIPPDGISTEELMSLGIPIFGIPKPPKPIKIDVEVPGDENEDQGEES